MEDHSLIVLIFVTIALAGYKCTMDLGEVREYCQWQSLNATCPADHMIMMTSARYGRMRMGKCLTRDYYIGCAGDVIRHADARCSGRPTCQLRVPDEVLHEVQPCPKDIGAYLEASYICVPVASSVGKQCHPYQPLAIDIPKTSSDSKDGLSGYISSATTEQTGLGTSYCPWTIRTHPGQRLNLTLFDFNILNHDVTSPRCQVYATIKQSTHSRDVTICGGSERTKHILLSDAGSVEIHITAFGAETKKPYFLIKYEVVGCPNIVAPSGGWMKRSGDTMVVGCNGTSLKSHLVCKGTSWIGDIRNCTEGGTDSENWDINDMLGGSDDAFPYGLLISIAIGVLLGILLGVLLLALVLACRKKKLNPHEAQYRSALMANKNAGDGSALPLSGTPDKNYATGLGRSAPGGPYAHIWEMGYHDAEIIHTLDTLPVRKNYRTCDGTGEFCTSEPQQTVITEGKMGHPIAVTAGHVRGIGREHLYESPKSGRREGEVELCAGPICPGPYYHEFDPTSTQLGCDGRPAEVGTWKPAVDVIPSGTGIKDGM